MSDFWATFSRGKSGNISRRVNWLSSWSKWPHRTTRSASLIPPVVRAVFCSTPWIISAPRHPNFTSQTHRNTTPIGTISPKKQLFGIEVNDSIARVAKMNMIIHDDGHSNVFGKDALINFDTLYNQHREFQKETFDLILTNPPFGAVVKKVESPLSRRLRTR